MDKKESGQIEKITEQLVIHGEHMSHLNKNIVETKIEVSSLRQDLKERYSNREIDSAQVSIKDSLDRIEQQTTLTNGRVTKLEKSQVETDKLIFGVKMTTWAVGGTVSAILSLICYIFITQTNNTQASIADLKVQISEIKK